MIKVLPRDLIVKIMLLPHCVRDTLAFASSDSTLHALTQETAFWCSLLTKHFQIFHSLVETNGGLPLATRGADCPRSWRPEELRWIYIDHWRLLVSDCAYSTPWLIGQLVIQEHQLMLHEQQSDAEKPYAHVTCMAECHFTIELRLTSGEAGTAPSELLGVFSGRIGDWSEHNDDGDGPNERMDAQLAAMSIHELRRTCMEVELDSCGQRDELETRLRSRANVDPVHFAVGSAATLRVHNAEIWRSMFNSEEARPLSEWQRLCMRVFVTSTRTLQSAIILDSFMDENDDFGMFRDPEIGNGIVSKAPLRLDLPYFWKLEMDQPSYKNFRQDIDEGGCYQQIAVELSMRECHASMRDASVKMTHPWDGKLDLRFLRFVRDNDGVVIDALSMNNSTIPELLSPHDLAMVMNHVLDESELMVEDESEGETSDESEDEN